MDDMQMKKNRKRTFWNALIALFLVALVASGAGFGWTLWRSNREDSTFSDLAKLTEVTTQTVSAAGETDRAADSGEETPGPNYQELAELNPDFVGWLRIEGTKVDYPVMHTPEDQQYYIHRDFYGKNSFSGTPFMGDLCDTDSQSIIIYAHNMNNGTMFGELDKYVDKSFLEAHPVIEFDTLRDSRRYEIFAAFQTRIFNDGEEGFRYYQYVGDLTKEQYGEFIDGVSRAFLYDTGITPTADDEFLLLSTCSYHVEDGRFVVVGRRVKE